MHPLYFEVITDLIDLTFLDWAEVTTSICQFVLIELVTDHGKWHRRSIRRKLKTLFKHVRHRTDVIFVRVSDHNTDDLVLDLFDIRKVRYQDVNTVHCLIRERHTYIDKDRLVICLDHHHVSTDLTETA